MAGEAEPAGWWGPGRAATGRTPWSRRRRGEGSRSRSRWSPTADHAPWHPGRCARLALADGTLVGHAGELHPKAVAALGLPARTVPLELDVDVLTAASEPTVQARELSTYPVAQSDVALVVDEQVAGRRGRVGAAAGRRRAARVGLTVRRLPR